MFLVLALISICCSSNILLTVPFSGSHFNALKNIAEILSVQGHNVTLLALEKDDRFKIMENVTLIHPMKWEVGKVGELISLTAENIVRNVRSSDMVLEALGSENWGKIMVMVRDFMVSDEMQGILSQGNFSVIISDIRAVKGISIAARSWGIPIVTFCPAISYFPSRVQQGLPMLVSSEPGFNMMIRRDHIPTFSERCKSLWVFLRSLLAFKLRDRLWDESLKKFGISKLSDLDDQVKLYLVNDDIAFSFPFLSPPNLITIGGYNFKPAKSLPAEFKTFLDSSGEQPVVYLSLGSYATLKMIPWLNIIISSLVKINARVILKSSSSDEFLQLSNNFLIRSWVPQIDLLGSGKVTVFISHCGNNGRLESIYYQVPLLCIPLWGDQLLNSNLVKYKGFGEMILKEDVEENNVVELLKKLIDNHGYYIEQSRKAVDIFKTAPVSSKNKLIYYIDLLIRHGNLDFLQNKIIKRQGFHEIYNLDIAFVAVLAVVSFIGTLLFILKRCLKKKIKSE